MAETEAPNVPDPSKEERAEIGQVIADLDSSLHVLPVPEELSQIRNSYSDAQSLFWTKTSTWFCQRHRILHIGTFVRNKKERTVTHWRQPGEDFQPKSVR